MDSAEDVAEDVVADARSEASIDAAVDVVPDVVDVVTDLPMVVDGSLPVGRTFLVSRSASGGESNSGSFMVSRA
jgi:hypothetical protein